MPGLHKANAKAIEFELHVRKGALTEAQWRSLILDVEEHFTVYDDSQVELHYRLGNLAERFLRVRGLRRSYIISPDSELGIAVMKCQLTAADPRVYNASQSTDNNNTGAHTVTNNGRAAAYPIVTFGRTAQTQVKITNSTTSQVLDINGFTASSGQSVVCNMDKLVRGDTGLIIYNPSTSVSYYGDWVVPRTPFYLAPGSNSITLNNGDDVSYAFYEPDPI
jgi:hypothetical protein